MPKEGRFDFGTDCNRFRTFREARSKLTYSLDRESELQKKPDLLHCRDYIAVEVTVTVRQTLGRKKPCGFVVPDRPCAGPACL